RAGGSRDVAITAAAPPRFVRRREHEAARRGACNRRSSAFQSGWGKCTVKAMRFLVLPILTTILLVEGSQNAFSECRTLAEARAANPGAHLVYQQTKGTRCWSPGSPHTPPPPLGTRKLRSQPAAFSTEGKPEQPRAEQAAAPPPRNDIAWPLIDPAPPSPYRIVGSPALLGGDVGIAQA